ncbi:MAG: DNA-binding protein [Prevotella sp.]|nr:DNA-binding protein [Prevotella sp.]
MLRYRLYQDNRRNATNKGAWYARPVITQTYSLEDLAQHMAEHDTPFSKGAIYGVLTDMVKCIQELTLDGVAVKIPNLAIFSVGLKSGSAGSVKDFNAAEHIKAFKLRARATGEYSPQMLKQRVKIRQYDEYKVSTDETETEPTEP